MMKTKEKVKVIKKPNYFTGSSRSKWKGPYSKIKLNVFRRILLLRKFHGRGSLFTYRKSYDIFRDLHLIKNRACVIRPKFVGKRFIIHTGRNMSTLKITNEHVGYRFGEFNFTTRRGSKIHKNNAKTKKNKTLKKK